jgi:gamma-glutamyltranspeptidase/glutathione hydrolase
MIRRIEAVFPGPSSGCRSRSAWTAGSLILAAALVGMAAEPPWIARGRVGMVASDSPYASRVGAEILRTGGNAFDAAIATSLALSVTRPEATGLGGGGFLLAYVAAEKRFVALDFREMAPAAATAEYYARLAEGNADGPSPAIYGGSAIAVPGQVAGLEEIRRRYATRSWAELAAPAINLAENGFEADEAFVHACREILADFEKWPALRQKHAAIYQTLLGNGHAPAVGDRIVRSGLAKALRMLAEQGSAAFYDGPVAAAIVKAACAAGAILTSDDLRSYRVVERDPLRARLDHCEIVTMPPPSSGGVCLIEALNVLECRAAHAGGVSALSRTPHYAACLVDAMRHAFADRARWLGDPDFCAVPVARLISRQYACELARRRPASPEDFGSLPEDRGTSHFCVADAMGNIVALTETINGTFGSLVIAEPYGIVLNNQMDDFVTVPGRANLYGLVQSQANLVGPGKRPLSSMAPTIVLAEERPLLVLGAAGGPRIISAVMQVILNVVERGQSLEEAIAAVRLHHQWQPDELYVDREPPPELVESLRQAGCTLSPKRTSSTVQAIQFLPDGTMIGASDPRRGGRPVGLP